METNFKDRWLKTDDENYVVLVPAFEDESVVVMHIDDAPELEFNLTCTLKDSVIAEVESVCAEYGVTPSFDAMAVTFRQS